MDVWDGWEGLGGWGVWGGVGEWGGMVVGLGWDGVGRMGWDGWLRSEILESSNKALYCRLQKRQFQKLTFYNKTKFQKGFLTKHQLPETDFS